MKKIRTTKHAKLRYKERVDVAVDIKKTKEVARQAYKYGLTAKHFKGKLREYLLEKSSNGARARLVVYKGIVFVFNRNKEENGGNKMCLITTYKLPIDLYADYLTQLQIKNECKPNKYKELLFGLKGLFKEELNLDEFEMLYQACVKAHKFDKIIETLQEGGIKKLYDK